MRTQMAILAGALARSLAGCSYNTFQTTDQQVEANSEQSTLTQVIEARSNATVIEATPALVNNPEFFQKFQQAQGQLTGALSRLMAVSENYPSLRANQRSRDLSAQ